jgi:hypothetical protein
MTQHEERTLVSFDWAMKHILRDKANFDVLEGFLSALLNDEMRVLSLLESETNQEHELDKYNRVDLLTVDSNEQIVMAHLPKPETVKQAHTSPPNGATTAEAEEEAVNIFPEYYLIEVGHFQNLIRHPIDEWIYLFKNSAVRDDFHSRNIQAAKAKLTLMHMSATERKGYEQFLLSRANALDVMTGHFQQGIEQGMALGKDLGKEEEKHDNARKMRQEGLDLALIARITGLSEAEIGAL